MAIYHFSAQVISRSQGRSAVAAAAYRAGEKLYDERYGNMHDYTKKNVKERVIAAPESAPSWVKDRARLWNTVEAAEKRKDAQLCREVNLALPRELTAHQQRELLSDFVTDQFVKRGMIADICIHRDNEENPHTHIMLTMREITPDGFGKKVREWNEKELLETWRSEWANYANRSLEKAGLQERIDHRSFEDQGKEILPTVHEGPHVRAMEKKGFQTDRGNINRAVSEYNALVVSLETYRREKAALEGKKEEKPPVALEKQIAVLTAKAQGIKEEVGRIEPEVSRIQGRLRYYAEQQRRMAERNRLEKEIATVQQNGRGLFGLYNKNSKELAELQRKVDNLSDHIQEHSRYVPSDLEANQLQTQLQELEHKKKELSGQFYAIRNKIKELQQSKETGQEKREQPMTLRQAILACKDKVKGTPTDYPRDDLDKLLQNASLVPGERGERLVYQLEGQSSKQVILFDHLYISSAQRNHIFDVIGSVLSGVNREMQRQDFASQQKVKKKNGPER